MEDTIILEFKMCPLKSGERHRAWCRPLTWKSLRLQEVTTKEEVRSVVGETVLPQVGRASICVSHQDTGEVARIRISQ